MVWVREIRLVLWFIDRCLNIVLDRVLKEKCSESSKEFEFWYFYIKKEENRGSISKRLRRSN